MSEENNSPIANVLKYLKYLYNVNPMFKFSLASKELFHSNFIDWMLNLEGIAKNEILNLFLGEDKKTDNLEIVRVFRETEHIDLIIAYRENQESKDIKLILIENKFKSYPYADQLDEYNKKEEKIKKSVKNELEKWEEGKGGNEVSTGIEKIEIVKKILLSIKHPFFFDKNFQNYSSSTSETPWKFISYESYLETIYGIINGEPGKAKNDKNITYLSDYYEFTKAIIDALGTVLNPYNENFCLAVLQNTADLSGLNELRINDLFQKNIGAQLLQKVQETYSVSDKNAKETSPKSNVVFLNELQISKRAQVNILRKYGEKNAILYGIRHHAGYIEYVLHCSKDADFNYPKNYQNFIELFKAIKKSFDEFIKAKYSDYELADKGCEGVKKDNNNIPQWNNRPIKGQYKELFKHSGIKINKKKDKTIEENAAYNKYYKENSEIQIYLRTKQEKKQTGYYESFESLSKEIVNRFNEMDVFLSKEIENIFKNK